MKQTWLKGWLSGKPHFIIGGEQNPYMYRWYVLPRNRFLNIYLHKFLRDDDDRALHDHPWWFISIMLKGGYYERVNGGLIKREGFCVAFRRATHRHQVILFRDEELKSKSCWTLIITGKVSRQWGFWCPKGFVRWQDFVNHNDAGAVGPGCGDDL